MSDLELIEQYAERGDEGAFTQIVNRHVGWVGLMAMRLAHGDPSQADDVTQAVFILLAKKTKSLRRTGVLSSWLFAATLYCARSAQRHEARLHRREREAAAMRSEISNQNEAEWKELSPILDELVGRLGHTDKQVVLLRFYQDMTFPQIGQQLRMSEEAARKRAGRALEKLRGLFARRGIKISSAALSTALAMNLSHASTAAAGTIASSALVSSKTMLLPPIAQSAGSMLAWAALKPIAVMVLGLGLISTVVTAIVLQETPTTKPIAAATTAPAEMVSPAFRYGRVITQDDKPVAGAEIWQLQYMPNSVVDILARTTSDAEGKFQLPSRDEIAYLFIRAKGFGFGGGSIGDESAADYPTDITMTPPTDLSVRFLDPDGKPVPGLRVTLKYANNARLTNKLSEELAQTTDEAGRCVFAGLPQNDSAMLMITDQRFASLSDNHDAIKLSDGPVSEGTVKLDRAASISGRVVYGDSGKPIAGVRVFGFGAGLAKYYSRAETVTDTDGKYVLQQLRPVTSTVSLVLPKEILRQYNAAGRENIRLAQGFTMPDQDFSLMPGAVISGKVTSKETGKPLAGTNVSIQGPAHPDDSGSDRVVIGEDGTYVVHVPPGRQMVFFGSPAPLGMREPKPRGFDFDLANGQSVTADFAVPVDPTPPLKGQVVDPQGSPVAGVRILVQRNPIDPESGGRPRATTDSDGRFSIPAIAAGNMLRARKGRSSTIEPLTVSVGAAPPEIKLVLHPNPMASIRVRVQQDDGTPVHKAVVVLSYGEMNGSTVATKWTDELGECTFQSLFPDMKYSMYFGAVGLSGGNSIVVRVRPGQQTEVGPIRMARANGFVAGVVLDEATGEPVENIQVYLYGRRSSGHSVYSGPNGRFRIGGLVPGEPLRIATQKDNRDSAYQQVQAGQEDLVLSPPTPSTAPAK